MKNKGFTLVELLAVIVIMGIIIGISIPAVTAVQKRMLKSKMNTFYSIVGESVDAYIEQYGKDFNIGEDCFEISYRELIKEDLLKEDDITCLSNGPDGIEGTIIARRVDNGNTFKYEYNLTCYDKNTNKKLSTGTANTTNCIGVNGSYSIEVKPILIDASNNESTYNGDWTAGAVRFDIDVYNPYFYELKNIQYQEKESFEWKETNVEITDSGVNGKGYILFETDDSINTGIKIRAVDINNNISGEKGYYNIKIDKVSPTCEFREDTHFDRAQGVNIIINCLDQGSGCASDNPKKDNSLTTNNKRYVIKDAVGNSTTCRVKIRTAVVHSYETRRCSVYNSCAAAGCNMGEWVFQETCTGTDSQCDDYMKAHYNDHSNYQYKKSPAGNNKWSIYSKKICASYKSGAVCGCNTYGSGNGDWSSWSTNQCPSGDKYNCRHQTWYYLDK